MGRRQRRRQRQLRHTIITGIEVHPGANRRLKSCLHSNLHVPVQAESWEEHPVQIVEGHTPLPLVVDEERQLVVVEVKEDADGGSGLDAAVSAAGMRFGVEEPGALVVDVHGPALVIFA